MSSLTLTKNNISAETIEKLILRGDLSTLAPEQKVSYYNAVCQSVGLNPLTNPFAYMRLNGKEVLYATRACTDQIRAVHKVSIKIISRELLGDIYVVTAQARYGDREDESTGAVPVKGLSGDALANAYMKAETKAKRRVTLSVCGLGLLDETEVETIPGASTSAVSPEHKKIAPPPPIVATEGASEFEEGDDPGSYVIKVGKKYIGKRLSEVPQNLLAYYAGWLSKQQNLSPDAHEFIAKVEEYIK